MGVDIHLATTIKMEDTWVPVEDVPAAWDCRCYELFKFLRDIGIGGIPEEIAGKKIGRTEEFGEEYYRYDTTLDYLYGHSYTTLDEIIKEEKKLNKVVVSEEFLNLFFELGGVLPEQMSLDKDDGKIYVEPLDEDELNVRDLIREGICQLKKIADKYGVKENEVKLAYAFDC